MGAANDNDGSELAKVVVETGESTSTESMWAKCVGPDLYEIRNTPFYARDINWGDVVHAPPEVPGHLPVVEKVVKSGGHKTLRIFFKDPTSDEERARVLADLNSRSVTYEYAWGSFYALDVPPEVDYQPICDLLLELRNEQILDFETGATALGAMYQRPH